MTCFESACIYLPQACTGWHRFEHCMPTQPEVLPLIHLMLVSFILLFTITLLRAFIKAAVRGAARIQRRGSLQLQIQNFCAPKGRFKISLRPVLCCLSRHQYNKMHNCNLAEIRKWALCGAFTAADKFFNLTLLRVSNWLSFLALLPRQVRLFQKFSINLIKCLCWILERLKNINVMLLSKRLH